MFAELFVMVVLAAPAAAEAKTGTPASDASAPSASTHAAAAAPEGAAEQAPEENEAAASEPSGAEEASAAAPSLEDRIRKLEEDNLALREALDRLSSRPTAARPSGGLSIFGDGRLRFLGYLDVGGFDAQGDGVAYVRDVGAAHYPEFADVPWVFAGDPWANTVNSQGDSADLGLDRTTIPRFDPMRSAGRPSFAVNRMNVGLLGTLSDRLLFETSLNFEPRRGELGSSGDQIDVDLAYAEWMPLPDLHVFVGKFESTFGIEYRRRKAPDRFGITPSLISRYTMGTPTGVKVRSELLNKRLNVNVGLTNGAMTTEKFTHFFDELDRNAGKTGSGRVGFAPFEWIEIGGSALYGTQDVQASDDETYRQFGADLRVVIRDVEVRAEWLRAEAGGDLRDDAGFLRTAPWLRAEGWYVEAAWQALPWVGVLARGDFRHAFLFADPNLYASDTGRATAGLRFDPTPNLIAKVEYLHVMELDGPELDDDILTTSFIFRF